MVLSQFDLSKQLISSKFFSKNKLSPSARLVLIVLCSHYPNIYPSIKTIQEEAGIAAKDTVIDGTKELCSLGIVKKKKMKNYGNWQNCYDFTNLFIKQVAKREINPNYEVWRDAVFKRDKYTCQHCFKRGIAINAHHIKPYSKYPEKRYDISNGITLCEDCHIEQHPHMLKNS